MSRARQIEQCAAEWLMRREEPGWSTDDQATLARWLDESMAHKAAFWRLEHGWRQADRIGALGPQPQTAPKSRQSVWLRRSLATAATIAIAFAGGLALWQQTPSSEPRSAVAKTSVGERGTLRLSDGSVVELNTASLARAQIAGRSREVWLDKGEAYFEVAHDTQRPFVVHAGTTTVTVLGTKFGVRRDGERVTVSVAEGRVRLENSGADAASRATVITAGDTALTSGGALMLAARSSERVEDDLAWRRGMLRFDQEPLVNVVAEFNRYNRRKIVVTDPGVGTIRIGGAFHANNSEAFLRLLQDAYGLRIVHDDEGVKISN